MKSGHASGSEESRGREIVSALERGQDERNQI